MTFLYFHENKLTIMKNNLLLFSCFLLFLSCNSNPSVESVGNIQNTSLDEKKIIYVCPPCNNDCDKLEFDKAGICPHCNMELILKPTMDNNTNTKKQKIAFYLQSGVEVLDFAGPMEVFAYAGFEVFTVSKTKDPIVSQGILKIIPDYSIEDAPPADILAFFGGNGSNTSKDRAVTDWVKSQKEIDYHFSVCTGAFILGEAGILKGKTATTFHDALDDFEERFPETKVLRNTRFIDNGNVITTAGISAGIDGALHLVAKLKGLNEARRTAYYMEYDKWIPGEGLILSEDNPYKEIDDIEHLNDYVGQFEFRNGKQLELFVNTKERSLYAKIEERNFPLFFVEKNKFQNVSGNMVLFKRNEKNEISGYSAENEVDKFYKKL